jgi:hypothetical protein
MKIKKSNFAYFYVHLLAFAFTDSAGSAEPTVVGDDLAKQTAAFARLSDRQIGSLMRKRWRRGPKSV